MPKLSIDAIKTAFLNAVQDPDADSMDAMLQAASDLQDAGYDVHGAAHTVTGWGVEAGLFDQDEAGEAEREAEDAINVVKQAAE